MHTRYGPSIAFGETRVAARARGALAEQAPHWSELSRAEREYCAADLPRLDRYAGRLAARAAIARVLGVDARSIAIGREGARPVAVGVTGIDVSISHVRGHAVAAAGMGRLGVDLVSISRTAAALARAREGLVARVMTPAEQDRARKVDVMTFAGALAAKEAVGKVLKRGWARVSWLDAEMEHHPARVPVAAREVGEALRRDLGLHRITFARCHTARTDAVWLAVGHRGDALVAAACEVPT